MASPYDATGHGGLNPNWEDIPVSKRGHDDRNGAGNGNGPAVKKAKKPTWHFSLPTTTDWDVTHGRLHGFSFGSEHSRGAIPLTPDNRFSHSHWSDDGPEGAPDNAPARAAYDSDHHWRPLADLISRLPGLADVVYRCPSQFPPCLLQAMHANPKPARLHLQIFKLRSAYDGSATVDPHEWAIINSPCLHSIWLHYRLEPEHGELLRPRQLDALMWMIRQVSPGLRDVKMVDDVPAERFTCTLRSLPDDGTPGSTHDFRAPVEPWNPVTFFNQKKRDAFGAFPSGKGHLTQLKLDSGYVSIPQEAVFGNGGSWIEKLDSLTDFSLLRTLALVQPVSQEQLLPLRSARLPKLATLSLACWWPWSPEAEWLVSPSVFFQTITDFLFDLPSLTALQISGWDHSAHVFSFHSPRLERLSLTPIERGNCQPGTANCQMQHYLTHERLALLVSSFPRLTDLSIPLKRSRGDSAKTALYRCIGEHLPNLRRLSLRLDCMAPELVVNGQGNSDTPLPKPYSTGPGWPAVGAALNKDKDEYAHKDCYLQRHRNGHVYDVFINSALDASLAWQIFAAVGGNVETLLVQTYQGLSFPGELSDYGAPWGTCPPAFMVGPFLRAISKQWMVTRMNNKVAVKEIGLERFRTWPADPLRLEHYHEVMLQYFRRVWPDKKEGSKGWFDDWESWRLQVE
jgi:hypothetical protein